MQHVDPNGPWIVKTEGDDEGHTIDHLGVYRGPLDRVALALAHRAFYKLMIRPLDVVDAETLPVTRRTVTVSVFDSGIDLPRLLAGRPVSVRASNQYESHEIVAGPGYDEEIRAGLAKVAKGKLTDEEYAALAYDVMHSR